MRYERHCCKSSLRKTCTPDQFAGMLRTFFLPDLPSDNVSAEKVYDQVKIEKDSAFFLHAVFCKMWTLRQGRSLRPPMPVQSGRVACWHIFLNWQSQVPVVFHQQSACLRDLSDQHNDAGPRRNHVHGLVFSSGNKCAR